MKRLLKAILLILMFGMGLPVYQAAATSGNEQLLRKAEELITNYKDVEALSVYEQVLAAAPDNYEALCKASFLHCRIGDRFSDDTHKLNHFAKAKQYAIRAYEINPDDAESNYVMALSLAGSAMLAGPRQRLAVTNQIKSFLDAALACNSEHAGSWHLLGRWYFKMANLNFAEVAASKVFFGGVCERPANDDAVEAMKMAIKYNPNNIRYYYDLATIYQEIKDNEAFVKTLEQALTISLDTKEELELSRRCKIMLQQHAKN